MLADDQSASYTVTRLRNARVCVCVRGEVAVVGSRLLQQPLRRVSFSAILRRGPGYYADLSPERLLNSLVP